MVTVLHEPARAARPARTIGRDRRIAQESGREVERQGRLADRSRTGQQDGVGCSRHDHRAHGGDRRRLAAGEHPVHGNRRPGQASVAASGAALARVARGLAAGASAALARVVRGLRRRARGRRGLGSGGPWLGSRRARRCRRPHRPSSRAWSDAWEPRPHHRPSRPRLPERRSPRRPMPCDPVRAEAPLRRARSSPAPLPRQRSPRTPGSPAVRAGPGPAVPTRRSWPRAGRAAWPRAPEGPRSTARPSVARRRSADPCGPVGRRRGRSRRRHVVRDRGRRRDHRRAGHGRRYRPKGPTRSGHSRPDSG